MTIANTNKPEVSAGAIDVIKLAQECGADTAYYGFDCTEGMKFYNHESLQAFANAVLDAAAEQCETSPDCLYAANAIREMKG
jgi:hypothetical protein